MQQPLIIGAGQAGLAMAYHLQREGMGCTLVDAHASIGASWRKRWDSLRLFSPARYSRLPGLDFPCDPMHLPTKDEAADYLAEYARRFGFQVRLNTRVRELTGGQEGYALQVSGPEGSPSMLHASTVIIATGAFGTPWIPPFEPTPSATLVQLHAADYHCPSDLPAGSTLVVGTGASGTYIAAELSATRKVYLSGPETSHMPRRFLGKDIYWWLYTTGAMRIKRDSWLGRKFLLANMGADGLIGKSLKEMVQEHGLMRCGMVAGFQDGLPVFEDGSSVEDIRSIVWATGYRNDYSWIHLPIFDLQGQPVHKRGIVAEAPGLYFIGLKFQHQGHSSNLGGVAEDAAYLARHISTQGRETQKMRRG